MKSYLIYDITPIRQEIEYILTNEFLDDSRLLHVNQDSLVEQMVMVTLSDAFGIDFAGRNSEESARVSGILSRMPFDVAKLIVKLPVPTEMSGLVCSYHRRGDDLYLTADHTP